MSAVGIRPMTQDDAPEFAGPVGALNATAGCHRGTTPDAKALRRAFLGTGAAGRLMVAKGPGSLAGGDLFVPPEARRRGSGRALVAAAARVASAEGRSYPWWTALPRIAARHAFYRSLGAAAEPIRAFALNFGAFERLGREDAT